MRPTLLIILFMNIYIYGQEIGCLASIKSKNSEIECSSDNILDGGDKESILEDLVKEERESHTTQKVKITEDLERVEVKFKDKIFTIERVDGRRCPPFCISPF